MNDVVYLDTSAVLRAVLERGLSPEIEQRIGAARFVVTSRLSLVESARAFLRLRAAGADERAIADAAHETDAIWARCTVWELTRAVCDLAAQVAPLSNLRTPDALHAATYLLARGRLGTDIELITADRRLQEALRGV